jgi:hypothetical protein
MRDRTKRYRLDQRGPSAARRECDIRVCIDIDGHLLLSLLFSERIFFLDSCRTFAVLGPLCEDAPKFLMGTVPAKV